jgi:hypothetical protein
MARPISPRGAKSSALSVRLRPHTRYGLTLLARVSRVSLSEVIEVVLEDWFRREGLGTLKRSTTTSEEPVPILDVTWDERPWVRLGRLALLEPELLTFRELRLWELLRGAPTYWRDGTRPQNADDVVHAFAHERLEADWYVLSKDAEVGI